MGAFAYCEEEDTYGAKNFKDSISENTKQERLSELMSIQEEIALELNEKKIGKQMEVVIDGLEDGYWIGRTEFDSPEVDPVVFIKKEDAPDYMPGKYYNVVITDVTPFELYGVPA